MVEARKPVVVIGHGPGVGDAVARAFAVQGRPAALIARDGERAEAAARAILGEAAGFTADASDEASLLAALEATRTRFGPPGVVLYNAALWRPGPVLATSADQMVADYRTDVVGALVAARWAAPLMGPADAILMTGGGLALHPSAQAPTLSIGKGAIRALAAMLAEELAPAGVRVASVTIAGTVGAPGLEAARVAAAFVELAAGVPDRATAELVLRP